MTVTWSDRYDPDPIIRRLTQSRTTSGEGKQTYEGFAFHECSTMIYDMLVFPQALPETQGRGIVNRALLGLAASKSLRRDSVLAEVRNQTQALFRGPRKSYILATSISISRFDKLPNLTSNGCLIRFTHSLPKAYRQARATLMERGKRAIFADPPSDYLPVTVQVSAISEHHAADLALDTLDLIRGIWNWYYNRRHTTRMSFGGQDPVNKIALGPIHSLHLPRGKLATDTIWFEPTYRAPVRAHRISPDWPKVHSFYTKARRLLRPSPYSQELQKSIIRYARALDDRDWHAAFLKMWAIIESLTGTTRDNSYDVTIRRAAFIYSEHDYVTQTLKVLRDQRNQLVHATASSGEIETYLYTAKNFVEALLDFHLANRARFASIAHATQFLDLPNAQDALRERHRLAEFALRFRQYTKRRKPSRAA